ncbi:hypothetical protein IX329_001883 [Fusobacterium necrophorum]|nr:autotransporter serine protease fusolisin [Fusobacterium necrophorum]KDE72721.1 hypothetical protein FUSO7_07720 [Fusobacterium necrophorum BFTR-2]MBR8734272.1 hypothetical protein [Fusobacterium necrophorum]MBR8790448.1 hypothetical protein [Fusobacterium necrophorum]MBR8823983.1 hypothetical protein [Fusobacterium necrophorum]
MKRKVLLLFISSILLISCGGGGGGGSGGSTNLPIRPTNPIEITPEPVEIPKIEPIKETKPISESKPVVNPSPEPVKNPKVIESKPVADPKPEPGKDPKVISDSKPIIGSKPTDPDIFVLVREAETKKKMMSERDAATEIIPTDPRKMTGDKQKVGILDSNFTRNKYELERKYPGIEIIDYLATYGSSSHGEDVLEVLRDKNKLNAIVASIGSGQKAVNPRYKHYKEIMDRFDANQKVKVFNQSFGSDISMAEFGYGRIENLKANLAPGVSYWTGRTDNEGDLIYNFYTKTVKDNGGLFVWAAGNRKNSRGVSLPVYDASIQAGLPKFTPELEKGWIAAVGIQKERDNMLNVHYKEHLAYPGQAAWWSISADGDTIHKENSYGYITYGIGSSFAAPRVSAAASLVAEKYDWMTADQVRQTLFTTTDRTEIYKGTVDTKNELAMRNTVYEPDTKYGWGMLNTNRALKGPGAFINILSQYKNEQNANNTFNANITSGTYYFENDIYGNGGLNKSGAGTLHLTGNNTYTGNSTVKDGILEVHKIHSSAINVEEKAKLVLHGKALVGYNNEYSSLIDEKTITSDKIIKKDVDNKGIVEIKGKTAIIGGDYITHAGSTTQANFGDKLKVLGNVVINGNVKTLSNDYITSTPLSAVVIEGESVSGKIEDVSVDGMRTVSAKIENNTLNVELARQNAVDYLETTEESSLNSAKNVEKVFSDLDRKVADGTATSKELAMGAAIQGMNATTFATTTEKLSGEIYASSQALTFAQAHNINRNLSNHLSNIDNLKNSNKEWQTWMSAMGSNGKLSRSGYASADTHVSGGQIGIDKKINDTTQLGIALAYSYAHANFNRYAGDAKSDMIGISLYGKKELGNEFYTMGRLGISHISTRVKRELVDQNGDTVQGDINHRDYMTSLYVEAGKKINWVTPFIGYSQDYLRRGSFSESNAAWGINASSKNYHTSNFLIGLRAEYDINKYKFQSYITQSINVGDRNLGYEGNFTGSSVKQKFYGIKLPKNTTWMGVGVFREITPNLGVSGNVDFRAEDKKIVDSVFSVGLQYKF